MFLFPFNFIFVFRSEWICCPFKNTESNITWWDSHIKSDLCCMSNRIWMFWSYSISRFKYMDIGSDLQRSGVAWSGQVSSGFALAARAARSQLALRACGARSRLAHAHSFYFALQKIHELFIHDNCKKFMNSYIIWVHICMNSYI